MTLARQAFERRLQPGSRRLSICCPCPVIALSNSKNHPILGQASVTSSRTSCRCPAHHTSITALAPPAVGNQLPTVSANNFQPTMSCSPNVCVVVDVKHTTCLGEIQDDAPRPSSVLPTQIASCAHSPLSLFACAEGSQRRRDSCYAKPRSFCGGFLIGDATKFLFGSGEGWVGLWAGIQRKATT